MEWYLLERSVITAYCIMEYRTHQTSCTVHILNTTYNTLIFSTVFTHIINHLDPDLPRCCYANSLIYSQTAPRPFVGCVPKGSSVVKLGRYRKMMTSDRRLENGYQQQVPTFCDVKFSQVNARSRRLQNHHRVSGLAGTELILPVC